MRRTMPINWARLSMVSAEHNRINWFSDYPVRYQVIETNCRPE